MTKPELFLTDYMDMAFTDQAGIVERAQADLAEVDFDTFVATGMSGTCVAPLLAHVLGKHFVIVRKPDDKNNHHRATMLGALGSRWLFIDDFISSGATHRRVQEAMSGVVKSRGLDSVQVGIYSYAHLHRRRLDLFEPEPAEPEPVDVPIL